MRAAVVREGRVVLVERPEPVTGPHEVLVRVRAAGLSGLDELQRQGRYPPPASGSDVLGRELAGEVVARGPAAMRFAEGDGVMGVVDGGAQAELAVAHEDLLVRRPEDLAWPVAGGAPLGFAVSHETLVKRCGLVAGERLLVRGAAGGVGVAAVQLGCLTGASVTVAVRQRAAADALRTLGADEVLEVAPQEPGEGFDVVLELVGAPLLGDDLWLLRPGGRIALVGLTEPTTTLLVLPLMLRNALIHGYAFREESIGERADTCRALEASVIPLLAAGEVAIPLAAVVPLDDADAAYRALAAPGRVGKVVLRMD